MKMQVLHDYPTYVAIWGKIYAGNDPWVINGSFSGNAYGPIYNLFAGLPKIHPKLPHLVFVLSYFISVLFLVYHMMSSQTYTDKVQKIALYIVMLNPIFLIFGLKYGNNDLLLAAFLSLGLLFIYSRPVLSGVFIAMSIAFKIVPILFLPILVFKNRRINFRFIAGFLFTFMGIYSISFYIWGENVFFPFLFARPSDPSWFSIYRSLEYYSINLRPYMNPLLIATLCLFYALAFFKNIKIWTAVYLCYTLIFVLSAKLNHQYWMAQIFCLAFFILENKDSILRSKVTMFSMICYYSWVFFAAILFDYTYGYHHVSAHIDKYIKYYMGIPTFCVSVFLIASCIKNIVFTDNQIKLNEHLSPAKRI